MVNRDICRRVEVGGERARSGMDDGASLSLRPWACSEVRNNMHLPGPHARSPGHWSLHAGAAHPVPVPPGLASTGSECPGAWGPARPPALPYEGTKGPA
jgi:hypothetical protein